MLQVNYIKENLAETIRGLQKKHFKDAELVVNQLIDLDTQRKDIQVRLDHTLSQANGLAKEIGGLMKSGQKEEAEKLKSQTAELKELSKTLEAALKKAEDTLQEILVTVPNLPHASVPEGRTPEENVEVEKGGVVPALQEGALPHWELIRKYDIIDFELGNKVSGADKAGYYEVQPPIVINAASGFGTGQLPDKEGQMYHATADDLYLIPTAEVPVTNMYRDVILAENDLPIKNVAYTPCFRREAGSWGAHVRGLNRLHQFDKVEIVQVTSPEKSYEALDAMLGHVRGLLEKLQLPYRILRLCGGDMSFTAALTYDFEVYSAAQERWLEVSSVSNFETYQANRLKLRYKVDGKSQLLHTLNGSALALPRILAALLENNQTPEGIIIPEVLRPYCGFDKID